MMDDEQLVAAVAAGGPEAFVPIVERYQDAVFGVALARLRNFHDAQDVAQQVLVEAFERLDSLRDPARLGAWLRSITIHTSIDHMAKRRDRVALTRADGQAADGAAPHDNMERAELREQVMAAIGRLSKTQSETTTLFYINGYSVAEVAGMQEVPVGTVKRRLHDARARLKEEMMTMVEDVLKSGAPKEDFGRQVFGILCRYRQPEVPWKRWEEIAAKLRELGAAGVDGYVRAFDSPHSPTRIFATKMLSMAGQDHAYAEELLKKALADPNRRVRKFALMALTSIMAHDEGKCRELIPCVTPLLTDRSKRNRWAAAWYLGHFGGCAKHVPLDCVAQAVVDETDPRARGELIRLMSAVLDARDKE